MKITKSKNLSEKQKKEIVDLWNDEYPKALSLPDLTAFEDYLQNLSDKHFLLLTNEEGKIMGWLFYFIRNNERFFSILLHPSLQGKGYGSKLLNVAKRHNPELNGWAIDNDSQQKQNGEYYKSPIGFYKKNGFEIFSNIQLKDKNIISIKVRWQNRI